MQTIPKLSSAEAAHGPSQRTPSRRRARRGLLAGVVLALLLGFMPTASAQTPVRDDVARHTLSGPDLSTEIKLCAATPALMDHLVGGISARSLDQRSTSSFDQASTGTLDSLSVCAEGPAGGPDVFGGDYVTPGDHPAFIQWETWSFEPAMISRCGAIRVSHNFALTAAHCTATAQNGRAYQGDGQYDDASWIPSIGLVRHPKADAGVDIAVIRLAPLEAPTSSLDYPVVGDRESQPLNYVVIDALVGQGQNSGSSFPVKVIGRGLDSANSVPTQLKQAFGAVVPDQASGNWPFGCSVAPVGFCVLFSATAYPCEGDSGGPVFDLELLVGVMSRGTPNCGANGPQMVIAANLWEERCWIDDQTGGEVMWRLADGTEQMGLPAGECTPEQSAGTACTVEFAEWTVAQNENAAEEAETAFADAVAAGENPDPADPAFVAEQLDTSCAEELCEDEDDLVVLVAESSTLVEPCQRQLLADWLGDHSGNELVCVTEYASGVLDEIADGEWSGNIYPWMLAECLLGAQYCPDPWMYEELIGGQTGPPCVGMHSPMNPCSAFWGYAGNCFDLIGGSDPFTDPSANLGADCHLTGAILATNSNQLAADGTLQAGGVWNAELAGDCFAYTITNCFIPYSYLDYLTGVEMESGLETASQLATQYVINNC